MSHLSALFGSSVRAPGSVAAMLAAPRLSWVALPLPLPSAAPLRRARLAGRADPGRPVGAAAGGLSGKRWFPQGVLGGCCFFFFLFFFFFFVFFFIYIYIYIIVLGA